MYLTVEKLKSKSACEAGIKWFEHYFPNGAELKEVILHDRVPNFFLYWGCEQGFFQMNEEEKEAYKQKLKIKCNNLSSIISSCEVEDSEYIFKGRNVVNSNYVSSGKKIVDSFMIQAGHEIERSKYVFDGIDIKDSQYIYVSRRVFNSAIVVNSESVIDSIGILNSKDVEQSYYVLGQKDEQTELIKNSLFIFNSKNLNKCLFCCDLEDKELMLFNKPISEQQYKNYMQKIMELKQNWSPSLIGAWCEEKMPLLPPQLQLEENYTSEMPNELLEWLKTLPEYNEEILLKILKR